MATLEEQVQRLEDIQEIRQQFSAHSYRWNEDPAVEFTEAFAQKQPDIRFELERRGVSDNQEGVRKEFLGRARPAIAPLGRGGNHFQTNYVIEVAGDGKTAQAVCLSPGIGTGAAQDGTLQPMWSWCRYGIDFIKEDGEWRYWHMHIFTGFNAHFNRSWVERSIDRSLHPSSAQPFDTISRGDRGTTVDAPFALNAPARLVPHLPKPYQTFKESMAYVPPPTPRDPPPDA